MKIQKTTIASLLSVMLLAVCGCANYRTPGEAAELQTFSNDVAIEAAFARKPAARFPANIATVRVQAADYSCYNTPTCGGGNYSVVLTRDVEDPEALMRAAQWPLVAGLAPLGRLLLPAQLRDDRELRNAAAKLHADMVLIYTFDTKFYESEMLKPIGLITLGLAPNTRIRIVSTASAILVDTRTGYIYGMAEATDRREDLSSAWDTESAVDDARSKAESAAFAKLVDELEKTWSAIVTTYASAEALAQLPKAAATQAADVP